MNKKTEEPKVRKEMKKVEVEEPKKEFKIEIVKVGRLEEKTAGIPACQYACEP